MQSTDLSTAPDYRHATANEVIAAFASNYAFRSAEDHELINEMDPFRRPVRPHDLELLDYSVALGRDDLLGLSSLLGHRMLMNAYETEYLFLPPAGAVEARESFRDYYAPESVALGQLARPILEHHLFNCLHERDGGGAGVRLDDLHGACIEIEGRLIDADEQMSRAIGALKDPRAAAVFALAQLTCGWQARSRALARGTTGEYADVYPALEEFARAQASAMAGENMRARALLKGAGLLARPRAYWQFYLSTTLARVNNLYRLARDHGRFFDFIGALVHQAISDQAFARTMMPALERLIGTAGSERPVQAEASSPERSSLVTRLVAPLVELYGLEDVAAGFLRGLAVAQSLSELAHADLTRQITWADDLERYKLEAERLQGLIDLGELDVHVDTFVESSTETSTTHVHDEHRLVVIASGEMVFWNNVGAKISLVTGEKMMVPRTRLHGSTVVSGECTYHQPVIPEEQIALK